LSRIRLKKHLFPYQHHVQHCLVRATKRKRCVSRSLYTLCALVSSAALRRSQLSRYRRARSSATSRSNQELLAIVDRDVDRAAGSGEDGCVTQRLRGLQSACRECVNTQPPNSVYASDATPTLVLVTMATLGPRLACRWGCVCDSGTPAGESLRWSL